MFLWLPRIELRTSRLRAKRFLSYVSVWDGIGRSLLESTMHPIESDLLEFLSPFCWTLTICVPDLGTINKIK